MSHHDRPYGIGLAYRPEFHRPLLQHRDEVDLLEISAIDYTVRGWRMLQDPQESLLNEALSIFPSAMHATSFSIGSVAPFDSGDVDRTFNLMQRGDMVSFSEHLAFHNLDGTDLHSFLPMPFDSVSLDWLTRKYNQLRARLSRPLGLENVSYLVNIPGCEMDEAEFLTELTRRTDCMLLLDVTNVFNNAHNHGYDPVEFIRKLPGDRIEQLHIAGGHQADGTWLDSHSEPVMDPVWTLLEETLQHTAAEAVILEKDFNYMPFDSVLRDVRIAREIFYRNRPTSPPPGPSPSERAADVSLPSTPGEAASASVDPDDPQFADLRNFQRALIRLIIDKPFRQDAISTPSKLQSEYTMADNLRDRLLACGRRHYDMLARKWHSTLKQERERDEEVRRMEWAAWAGA